MKIENWKLKIITVGPYLLLGLVVFLITWLPTKGLAPVFGAMDELANWHFIQYFTEYTSLKIPEPLNELAPGLVAPGWVQVAGVNLIPGGFAGFLFLYGFIAKVFGIGIVPMLTPLLAAIGVVAFAWLVGRFTRRTTGLLAGIIFAVSPPFWHFAIHGLFPNVAFLSLTLLALALIVAKRARWESIILAGAIFIRPSEVIWVAPLALTLGWRSKWLVAGGISIGLVGFLATNWYLYGSPFAFAYSNLLEREYVTGVLDPESSPLLKALFPFGVHPRVILENLWWNFLRYGFIPLLAGIGLAAGFYTAKRKLFWTLLAIAGWILVVYGSFDAVLSEGVNPARVLVASPVGRYFLSLWAVASVLAAMGISWIISRYPSWARMVTMSGLVMIIALASFQFVFFDKHHGVVKWRAVNRTWSQWQAQLLSVVPPDTVVVSGKLNRLTWPSRTTIFSVEPDQVELFHKVASVKPVVIIESPLMMRQDRLELVKSGFQSYHGLSIVKQGAYSFGTVYRLNPKSPQ